MKTYTVRFRCKARLEHEESTTETDYELQLKAENLEDVYTRLDDYLENWEEGASLFRTPDSLPDFPIFFSFSDF